MGRIRRISDGCGFASARDINPEAMTAFLATLKTDGEKRKAIGHRTYNHYVRFAASCTVSALSVNPFSVRRSPS